MIRTLIEDKIDVAINAVAKKLNFSDSYRNRNKGISVSTV